MKYKSSFSAPKELLLFKSNDPGIDEGYLYQPGNMENRVITLLSQNINLKLLFLQLTSVLKKRSI